MFFLPFGKDNSKLVFFRIPFPTDLSTKKKNKIKRALDQKAGLPTKLRKNLPAAPPLSCLSEAFGPPQKGPKMTSSH
ncbi:rCG63347, partial [Rattus norvegicus]